MIERLREDLADPIDTPTAPTVNIYSRSTNWVEAILSHFAHTPFVLDGESISSIEGFHQGIKYEDILRRRKIFRLWGARARSSGARANRDGSRFVYWGEGANFRSLTRGSDEYHALYYRALFAKFTQNEPARQALLMTGDATFSHVLPRGGMDWETFQANHVCRALYRIRAALGRTEGE